MNMSPQRLADYLGHIRDAISRIERYTALLDEQDFLNNELIQDAVLRNFEVTGEARGRIEKHDKPFADAPPELSCTAACPMRNVIAHGYFQLDFRIVWSTVKSDLPRMRDELIRQGDS